MSLVSNRHRRGQFIAPKLMITSMMDMFTIILIFLLFSFSDNPEKMELEKDLDLPYSSAQEDYDDSIRLILSQGSLILDGTVVATLRAGHLEGLDSDRLKESDLYKRLISHKMLMQTQGGDYETEQNRPVEKKNKILFLCDKKHTFKIINPVIKTAGLAGFPNFQFAVLKE